MQSSQIRARITSPETIILTITITGGQNAKSLETFIRCIHAVSDARYVNSSRCQPKRGQVLQAQAGQVPFFQEDEGQENSPQTQGPSQTQTLQTLSSLQEILLGEKKSPLTYPSRRGLICLYELFAVFLLFLFF